MTVMKKNNRILKLMVAAAVVAAVIMLLIPVSKRERKLMYATCYRNTDSSYSEGYFADKKVLFVVPHEDDEYNIGSGIMEKYVDCGSDVRVIFVTNGDMYGGADIRYNESTNCMKVVGIPEDKLYFLGYGDSWDSREYGHIYNAPGDEVVRSAFGAYETYGTETHLDYRTAVTGKSAQYTRNNIKQDIRDIIMDFEPDVIYAIDLDEHWDHRAVSLLFEEVMGEILADVPDYTPGVFKGFGYCTAWDAPPDFYDYNVGATVNPGDSDVMEKNPEYLWSQRVRIPVAERYLAYTKRSSAAYSAIEAFDTQFGMRNFRKIVNSDKVFWERRCDGLSYTAEVSVSSGDMSVLNDFKLMDLEDVNDEETYGKKGVWIPAPGDTKRSATYTFAEPQDVYSVVLYENPSGDDNIIEGVLEFDDGTVIPTGPLPETGSRYEIETNVKHVSSVTFSMTDHTGENAGLTEMEVYTSPHSRYQEDNRFIKIMSDDNFIYDYLADTSQPLDLQIYSYPSDQAYDPEDIVITVDGIERTDVAYADGHILVPYNGENCEVAAYPASDPSVYDTVHVKPAGFITKKEIQILQIIEGIRDRKREEVIEY